MTTPLFAACDDDRPEPPVTKYLLTITIRGNSHDEIVDELVSMTRGGYLLASNYYKRDSFNSTGGRDHMVLEHTNPDQTPSAYQAALDAWWKASKFDRAATNPPTVLDGITTECLPDERGARDE